MRVAYTLEQCWHRVPGGTGVAAIEVAKELAQIDGVDLVGVAGRHKTAPSVGFEPPVPISRLPIGGPFLYESWLRLKWPLVESVVGNADLVHSTTIIPPATKLPLVVTIHDLAFLRHPEFFTDRGNKVFRRSLERVRDSATVVLCSSQATFDDCLFADFERRRLRLVPLGVTTHLITDTDRDRVRAAYNLPSEFILFVGTLEPRKNLARLIEALHTIPDAPPLVIVGMEGWGDQVLSTSYDIRFTGFVPAEDLPALYEACSVFAFPSLLEGYGLPVIEAMAHGAPVVTSRGTSTEEVAGGAAVLVDPLSVESIAEGITTALATQSELRQAGLLRAANVTWAQSAALTAQAYRETLRDF
ncbi:MAG: glycosyltransferase [Actinobacteria bacterium]|nr:glycosyltransferase [Actinomycetota bacterium]